MRKNLVFLIFVVVNFVLADDENGNGQDGQGKNDIVNSWKNDVEKTQEIIKKIDEDFDLLHNEEKQSDLQIVKPWSKEVKRIHEIMKKIDEDVRALAPRDRARNRVKKHWLEELQWIEAFLRKVRQNGSQDKNNQEENNENELYDFENYVQIWFDKLRQIQKHLIENRQKETQNKEEPLKEDIDFLRDNEIKPWLDKLQRIQESLREIRQTKGWEKSESGRPRHHLIGRRPPVGRTSAPKVPRAVAMHRTKHPMPFPDNDEHNN